jgi:hypothetical protein
VSTNDLDAMINEVENGSKPSTAFAKVSYLEMREEGCYTFNILSFVGPLSRKYPVCRVLLHQNFIDPNRGTPSIFKCIGEDCPLCVVAAAEEKAGNPNAWKRKAQETYLYQVADASGKYRVLKAPLKAHLAIEKEWLSKAKDERMNIFLNDSNFAVALTKRRKTGQKGNYYDWDTKVAMEPTQFSHELLQSLQTAKPLNKCFMEYTKEQLQAVVDGKAWRTQKQDQAPEIGGRVLAKSRPNPAPIARASSVGQLASAQTGPEISSVVQKVDPSSKLSLFPNDETDDSPSEQAEQMSDEQMEAMELSIFGEIRKR